MESPIRTLLHIKDPDLVESWIRCITVLAWTNLLRTTKINGGENHTTDLFLASASCKVFRKISLMTYSTEMEELTFNQMKEIIVWNILRRKRLLIPKRTKFSLLKQECDEAIMKFLHRLPDFSRYFEFQRFRPEECLLTRNRTEELG